MIPSNLKPKLGPNLNLLIQLRHYGLNRKFKRKRVTVDLKKQCRYKYIRRFLTLFSSTIEIYPKIGSYYS